MNTHESKREATGTSTALSFWMAGAAVGLVALLMAAGEHLGTHPPTPGEPSAAAQREATPEVTRIDQGVVRSIEPNAEPDATGASVAAYSP